jgi:hypothetical protein
LSAPATTPAPLDAKALRKFGLTVGLVLVGLFGLALPLWKRRAVPATLPIWPWPPGGLLCLLALVAPTSLRGFHALWMRAGGLLGWVNTRLILTALFLAVFTPIGLVMRLFGRDPMGRKLDRKAKSFRIESQPVERKSMEAPF